MWSNFNPPRKDFLICTTQVDLGQEHSLGRRERPQAPVLRLPFAVLLKKNLWYFHLFSNMTHLVNQTWSQTFPWEALQHGSACPPPGPPLSPAEKRFPTLASKSWPKFSFKNLSKPQLQNLDPTSSTVLTALTDLTSCCPFLPLVLSQYLKAPWSYYSSLLDPTWWVVYRLYKYLVRILEFLCESHLLRLYIIGVFQPSECSISDL